MLVDWMYALVHGQTNQSSRLNLHLVLGKCCGVPVRSVFDLRDVEMSHENIDTDHRPGRTAARLTSAS